MTPSRCKTLLPSLPSDVAREVADVAWEVALPAGSRVAVIGRGGTTIQALQRRLEGKALAPARLHIEGTMLRVMLSKVDRETVKTAKAFLSGELLDIQRKRLQRSQHRRAQVQDARCRAGKEYQACLLRERAQRRLV